MTEAVVTVTEQENLGKPSYSYSYRVGQSTFDRTESGSALVGHRMKIFHLLSDPSVSTILDPTGGLRGLFGTALLSATFITSVLSLFGLFGAVLSTTSRRAEPPST